MIIIVTTLIFVATSYNLLALRRSSKDFNMSLQKEVLDHVDENAQVEREEFN